MNAIIYGLPAWPQKISVSSIDQISGDSEDERSILLERTLWFPSRFTKADKAFTSTLSPDVLKEEFVCSVGIALNE
jgi:hypothetical protein